jgi:hypothetical protein
MAEPEEVSLDAPQGDVALDEVAVADIVGTPASLNGHLRRDGASSDDLDWMEPPPGTRPTARTRLQLSVEGDWGGARLTAPSEVYRAAPGELVRSVFYTLTVAVGRARGETALRWWLEPGGDDATLRTDALDFLAGLHRGGVLSAIDAPTGTKVLALPLEEQPFDEDLEHARHFLEQVATLEEWSGSRIPLPDEVNAEEATAIARAVAIVHARQIPLALGEELTLTIRATEPVELDEVRLPRELVETVLGARVPLGTATIAASVVAEDWQRVGDDALRVRCRLADDQPRQVLVHLYPPRSRTRYLRRTLVAGSPVPTKVDGLLRQVDALRLDALDGLLAEWEALDGPLNAELQRKVAEAWPD